LRPGLISYVERTAWLHHRLWRAAIR